MCSTPQQQKDAANANATAKEAVGKGGNGLVLPGRTMVANCHGLLLALPRNLTFVQPVSRSCGKTLQVNICTPRDTERSNIGQRATVRRNASIRI